MTVPITAQVVDWDDLDDEEKQLSREEMADYDDGEGHGCE